MTANALPPASPHAFTSHKGQLERPGMNVAASNLSAANVTGSRLVVALAPGANAAATPGPQAVPPPLSQTAQTAGAAGAAAVDDRDHKLKPTRVKLPECPDLPPLTEAERREVDENRRKGLELAELLEPVSTEFARLDYRINVEKKNASKALKDPEVTYTNELETLRASAEKYLASKIKDLSSDVAEKFRARINLAFQMRIQEVDNRKTERDDAIITKLKNKIQAFESEVSNLRNTQLSQTTPKEPEYKSIRDLVNIRPSALQGNSDEIGKNFV